MGIRKKGNVHTVSFELEKWKPMQLNEAILNGGIEGLVGIEELVDYKPTFLQKKPNRNYGESSTKKIKNDKNKTKRSQSQLGDKEKLVTKRKPLKTKREKKSNSKLQKQVLVPAKLHKKSKEDANNSNSGKPSEFSEESEKQDTFNKFLQSEQLEVELPLVLKTLNKKRKGKKKESQCKQGETDTSPNLGEQRSDMSCSSPSKTRKRSQSPKTVHNELPPKKIKRDSKQNKMKGKRANAYGCIPDAKTLATKKQARVKTKKNAGSSKVQSNTENVENTEFESNSPVTGMERWAGLNLPESVLRALAEKGFNTPTEIQTLSLPAAILGRRDIMGAAETGSGKTLAFGIPIIYGILQQKKKEARMNKSNMEEESNEVPTIVGDVANNDSDGEESENGEEAQSSKVDEGIEENDENGSGYESEGIEGNAEGIGCVQVIDNIDMGQTIASNPSHNRRLYALVLTPTRELAVQVRDHIKAAAKYTGIKVAVVIGGLAAQKQERLLRAGPEIVVATPGRLWEMIQEGNAHLQQVDNISFLAIDETDRMVEQGHFQELQELLERINQSEQNKKIRQNFVFSATLTMVHEPPHRKKNSKQKRLRVTPGQKLQEVITMVGMCNPKVVDITRESGTCESLREAQISCTFEEKDIYLYYFLIKHPGRTLIFCNSISCVRRLAQLLTILMCKPLPIHANMIQRQRLRNLDKFRDSPTGLLLATDVAARGLDIPDVQHVIHYQVPRTSEGYIHRSGRTARASKEGLTLLLVEPNEQQSYARLCRSLGRHQQLPVFPVSQDLLDAAKQRMVLARDIDQLELTSRRADSEKGWFQKAMTDMDIFLDDDELPMRISKKDSDGNRHIANKKRKLLDMLLSRPLFSSRVCL